MLSISDYEIFTEIQDTLSGRRYLGRQISTGKTVVLRHIHQRDGLNSDRKTNKKSLKKLIGIASDHLIRIAAVNTIGLKGENGTVLVYEDIPENSLFDFLDGKPLDIPTFLNLSVQLATALSDLHQGGYQLTTLSTKSIFIDPESVNLQLDPACVLPAFDMPKPEISQPEKYPPSLHVDNLPYISPEMTGRMNCRVDYRSGFYILGTVLYEMLTGQPPFHAGAPMEIIHAHIAQKPVPPGDIRREIPKTLSDIVIKLLAKIPNERYQSAFGLLSDLKKYRKCYESSGGAPEFTLAGDDVAEQFQLPMKLYGRKNAIRQLAGGFETARQGGACLMLISGCSGIGKSRLVREVSETRGGSDNFFISGKYNPYHRHIPYGAIILAFQDLVNQLLTSASDRVAMWKSALLSALGSNGQIIIDVIPEVEHLIGPQPEAPTLPPTEAQNRFNMAFGNFIQVFAAKGHPLTIHLDDLQWADVASLKLLQSIFTEPTTGHLLIIGTYRNDELDPDHPLPALIERIRHSSTTVNEIALSSLTPPQITEMISDALKKTGEDTQALAEIVYSKTQGNPLSVGQFLQSLNEQKLLVYDYSAGVWQWDTESIQSAEITTNIVTLMATNVRRLPQKTQAIMKLAACIGNRFELKLLSLIANLHPADAAYDIWPAVDEGFIVAAGESYRQLRELAVSGKAVSPVSGAEPGPPEPDAIVLDFLHDKVRDAVYLLLPDEQRARLHHRIGRLMLTRTDSADLPNRIFSIVSHLNYGIRFITDKYERNRLARLNLMAGKKAKSSTAHASALTFLSTGESLLAENSWSTDYNLTFGLKKELMECEYLNLNFEKAERLFESTQKHAKTRLDRAAVYNLKMIMLASLARHNEALAIGLAGLRLLGVNLPDRAGKTAVLAHFLRIRFRLISRRIDSLARLPEIQQPEHRLMMRMLMNLTFSAYLCNPNILIVIALKTIELTLKFGRSPVSPFGWMIYGAALCAVPERYATGCRFGRLALEETEKTGSTEQIPKIYLYYGGAISIWQQHLRTGLDFNRRGIEAALESGDVNYAVYHIQSKIMFLLAGGASLDQIGDECEAHYDFVCRTKDIGALNYLTSVRQFVKSLKGETNFPGGLDDDDFKESYHTTRMEEDDIPVILFRHYLLKIRLLTVMGKYREALPVARKAMPLLHSHIGAIVVPEFQFYTALLLTSLYSESGIKERIRFRITLFHLLGKLRRLARTCPENFKHKYLLIRAEQCRITGRERSAMTLYRQAIDSARDNGFIQIQALANEVAARFYRGLGFTEIAKMHFTEARRGYLEWGATAKAADLEKHHPDALPRHRLASPVSSLDQLDFKTVVESLQMISTEIIFEDLLKKLLKIVAENAGASRIIFLTLKNHGLFVEAENTFSSSTGTIFESISVDFRDDLFISVINYVRRTRKYLALDDAINRGDFTSDPYVLRYRPRSVMCLPIIRKSNLLAILYLENEMAAGAFTPARIEVIRLLASQAAISLENARLYNQVIRNERVVRDLSRKREEEALEYQSQLRSLSSELLLTEERERRRIAQDLHDRIGHALTSAAMKLGALRQMATSSELTSALNDVAEFIDQSIQDTHTLTFELSPPILYDLGLEAALDWLVEQTREQYGIRAEFNDDMAPKQLPESHRVLLFQATRELLFNVVKHAQAGGVSVSIGRDDSTLRIAIEDDGVGFDPVHSGTDEKKAGGFGLFSIRERLRHQGGHLEIDAQAEGGTCITMFFPLPEA